MSAPPAKRLKQTSLRQFSFKQDSKEKLPSVKSTTSGTTTDPIVLEDSSSEKEDKELPSDLPRKKKTMDKSPVLFGKTNDATDDSGSAKSQQRIQTPGRVVGASTTMSHPIVLEDSSSEKEDKELPSDLPRKNKTMDKSPVLIGKTNDATDDSGSAKSQQRIQTPGRVVGASTTMSLPAENKMGDMSPDLFTDSEPLEDFLNTPNDSQELEDYCEPSVPLTEKNEPRGVPIDQLNRTPTCSQKLPSLTSSSTHTVLFKLPYQLTDRGGSYLLPHPDSYHDRWDSDHVRMPCSHENEYPIKGTVKRRWELIERALRGDLSTVQKLKDAILSYNSRYVTKWDFSALYSLFNHELSQDETDKFFKTTLRNMASLALKLPHLCTKAIPLLKKGQNQSITLSQQQISCLLANAFFCTFPRRNAHHRTSEYNSYPDINFNSLFAGSSIHRKIEKLKCILHYFGRVTEDAPSGTVTFTRQTLDQLPDWSESTTMLMGLHVSARGTIEDDGLGMLQVDFANKYLGGGVLNRGCVQEEIRFLICPEMILSRLFTEALEKNESLVMIGCERYSDYTGYADNFLWKSNHIDSTPRDEWGRICTEVVAIDAMVIRGYSPQFKAWCVKRELDKAYCGFQQPNTPSANLPAVCTGNWGCGAFGGDKQLKALIQIMAAAEARRDVCYFTFDDAILQDELFMMHIFLRDEQKVCICDILQLIQQYYRTFCMNPIRPDLTLFDYLYKVFQTQDSTDSEIQEIDEDSREAKSNWKHTTPGAGKLKKGETIDYKANTP